MHMKHNDLICQQKTLSNKYYIINIRANSCYCEKYLYELCTHNIMFYAHTIYYYIILFKFENDNDLIKGFI